MGGRGGLPGSPQLPVSLLLTFDPQKPQIDLIQHQAALPRESLLFQVLLLSAFSRPVFSQALWLLNRLQLSPLLGLQPLYILKPPLFPSFSHLPSPHLAFFFP